MNTGRTHFKKGHTPWSKGKSLSKEHRKNLSKALKGRKSWNKGLRIQCNTGKTHFKKGQEAWNKGTKGVMKAWNKGTKTGIIPKTAFKKGCISWCKGMVGYTNAGSFKKGHPSLLTKEQIRKILKRRPISGLEKKVLKVIKKNKLPYKFVGNGDFFIERKNPDFVNINGKKIAVEVYCRRHKDYFRGGCDKWKEDRAKLFAEYGWETIFIEDWQTNKEETTLGLLSGDR